MHRLRPVPMKRVKAAKDRHACAVTSKGASQLIGRNQTIIRWLEGGQLVRSAPSSETHGLSTIARRAVPEFQEVLDEDCDA